ncbi:condensin-2 complex subunit H2-like [Pomacea canaliculata]|uniref:condensin-2 complex subunit H2-like n=1 Tax=Pomacea canaliculata TaxID=400727 RepID=UPI000D73D538|nr:condensin-2 complex subunit H2-like [Pomacea canaliculata]XP_025087698.1 condensin-2 complex subunit H2-like [Pomacea canaliculata]
MVGSSQTMDLEARFGHILQPIRDLTRNWDVDIAGYLEEYLEDLEKIVITFNNGQTTMNFAEAALLIQGSACVYSKKVEYLYTLVYQVLDMIANKKKQKKQSSVDEDGNDADADFNKEDKEEFLVLDDTKETKQEKLQNHDDPGKESQVLPRTPANLVAQEEGEKEPNELLNHKGEVLGNLSDFQLNRSKMRPEGGVYLDSNLLPFIHSHLRLLASSTPFPVHNKGQLETTEEGVKDVDVPENKRADLQCADVSMQDGGDDVFEQVPEDEGEKQLETVPQQLLPKKVQFALPKPHVDHWVMLDPYSAGTLCEKKQKVGRTFKLPPCVEQSGTKKRKRKGLEKKLQPILDFVQARVFSHRPKFPKDPAKVPTFPEFDDMFWKEFKRREESQKQKRKQQIQLDVKEQIDEQLLEENDIEDNWPAQTDDPNSRDDGDGGDNFEPSHFQMQDNLFGPVVAFGGEFINSLGSSGSVGNSYEELVRQHVENYLESAAKYVQISELSKRVAEWEEKIIPRLQEEEQREQFDIHKYGTKVIEPLRRNQKIPFRQVVAGKPIFQIGRLFLATLQLANTYNVELSCPGYFEEAMDRLEIRLLSHKRHYEELAEYQAPSLAPKK